MKKAIAILALLTAFICSLFIGASSGIAAGALTYFVADSLLARWIVPHQGMAFNTLGTLAATGVFHDALGLILKKLPMITGLASNFNDIYGERDMAFNVAQTLKDYNATIGLNDVSSTGTYAIQSGQALTLPSDKTVTLNKWYAAGFKFTLAELNQMIDSASNADARAIAVRKLMARCFNKLGTQIANDFLAIVDSTNYADNAVVSGVGTADYKTLGGIADTLLQRDALASPNAILNVAMFREVANSLTGIANPTVDIGGVVSDAEINFPLSGMKSVQRYNLTMPTDAARGIVFSPEAAVVVNRIPKEDTFPGDTVYLEPIIDSATGFKVLLREHKDVNTGEVHRNVICMYGFAPALAKYLVRIAAS